MFNRGGVDQARTCTPLIYPPKRTHFLEWGGGDRGCSLWCRPRTIQHVASPPPYPHSCPGKNKRCPSTALNVAYPPPKNPPNVEWGGGDRGCSPWRRPRTALKVAYPPPKKTTIRVMGEGKGVFNVASLKHGSARRPSPLHPPPPPHSCPGKIKIKNETYLFGGQRQLTVNGNSGCRRR